MNRTVAYWLAKCALCACALIFVCGLATVWFGNGLQLPSTTTRDGTLITLNRYSREPIPDVVLVGSSLSFRLKEQYFVTPRLRNLALAGGSPVTGLEIVSNQQQLPKIILIETNVLSRPTDAALVERYSRRGNAEPLIFRPIRTAVAAYENWNHAPLSHAQVASALGQLLEQPPSDFDNTVYVDRALQEENAYNPAVAVLANTKRIEELISSLERRGTRVLLFRLPYSNQLEEARSIRITREIVHTKFPDPGRWLAVNFGRNELRWADGAHLDERSAVIISNSIDRALSPLLGSM